MYINKKYLVGCNVDDSVGFLELLMFIDILFDKVDRGVRHEKKTSCYLPFISFFKKNSEGWLTLIENKYYTEKDDYVQKIWEATTSKE